MNKHFAWLLFAVSTVLFALPEQAEKHGNFSHYYRQDCTFVVGGAADNNDWCNRGNAQGKAPNVVLIGDSYGNSVTTILEEYARTASKQIVYEQYGRGQCPELLGIGPKGCGDFAQAVYERIKKMPSVKTVVLVSHWVYYFGETRRWNDDARIYTRAEMQKALAETIKAYQALGKKVVFVYQAPEIDEPKACVQRRIRIAAAEDKCQMTKEWGLRNEVYRPFVDPILVELKVETFDPFDFMCDDKSCKVKEGDKIFFASQAHFSGFGGQYLARKAALDLKKLLQF